MRPRILLTTAGAIALAAAVTANAWAQDGAPGLRASAMPPQGLAIVIRPATGTGHDEHLTLPAFAVEPGLPVRLTFTNYTSRFHTFTAPGLGVSALIRPAHGSAPTTTVVTFTAHKHGAFDWVCLLCPDQGSGSSEAMRGKIYAIVQV
jgi:plastocyanin